MLLDAIVKEPSKPAKASVLWLHGLGADGFDFVDVIPMLHLEYPIRFVFPHAPQRPITLNMGMRMPGWYDIASLHFSGLEDEKGIREAQTWIEALIQNEIDRGIPADKIFLIGFSQGGAMAAFTALRYAKRIAGCAILSGYLPLRETLALEVVHKDVPVFMAHGFGDMVVALPYAQQSRDILMQEGINVSFHTYPMAHQVCAEEMRALGEWMMHCINNPI